MNRLYRRGGLSRKIARVIHHYIHFRYACHISPQATIEGWINLPHPLGITVGHGVVIADNATIYQNVTLGKGAHDDNYPRVSSGATLFTGSVVLGGIEVGTNAKVGANAVVLQSVPAGCTAVGVPARVICPGSTAK
ncbi:hypothetical protein G3572_06535 [Rhodobacter sp. ETT8]|uniref:Serine acetyltransferase n=1 Tax=Pseudotabrizicola algicola TaxID=2709381 RepID=A0A6B3RL53_9RHOB|nr:hypothetical protein [Pseudotabrizicola algicola]